MIGSLFWLLAASKFDICNLMTTTQYTPSVQRALRKLGQDIKIARKKRRMSVEDFASRKGMAAWCHQRVLEGLSDINAGRDPGRRTPPQKQNPAAAFLIDRV